MLGMFAGIWFAYFSLVISLLVGWYIRDINRRDKDIDRRFGELEADIDRRFGELGADIDRRFGELGADIDRRFGEMEEANERRHQELLKAISPLYQHVHADGSPAIVPLPDIDPVVPAPADN